MNETYKDLEDEAMENKTDYSELIKALLRPSYPQDIRLYTGNKGMEAWKDAIKEYTEKTESWIKHYVWEEEGKQYSAWKINTGTMSLTTGDGGMALFNKALKEHMGL